MEILNDEKPEVSGEDWFGCDVSKWKDWKWQLKNAVKSVDAFERLWEFKFPKKKKLLWKKQSNVSFVGYTLLPFIN
jgi:lysine 2,3-aminomutase